MGPIAKLAPTCPSRRSQYNNRQVIGAFITAARELNQNGWQLLAKAGLADLLFHVDARYASPRSSSVAQPYTGRAQVIMRALLGVKPLKPRRPTPMAMDK